MWLGGLSVFRSFAARFSSEAALCGNTRNICHKQTPSWYDWKTVKSDVKPQITHSPPPTKQTTRYYPIVVERSVKTQSIQSNLSLLVQCLLFTIIPGKMLPLLLKLYIIWENDWTRLVKCHVSKSFQLRDSIMHAIPGRDLKVKIAFNKIVDFRLCIVMSWNIMLYMV